MVWDRGPHHLQIEVLPGGIYDWFYRHRETGAVQFEEDLALDNYSPTFEAVISRIAAG